MERVDKHWWRMLLKDKISGLYTRVDFMRRTDDSVDILLNLGRLGIKISLVFDGDISATIFRGFDSSWKKIAEQRLTFNGEETVSSDER